MYFDFAPMEGITGAAFRRVHHKYFCGVDRYYTPFLSPTKEHVFTPREQREFYPEQNKGIPVVPQILTKVPEDFLWAAEQLHQMGYEEVNLNLGCPSGTVTAKGKGCGMLSDVQSLDRFLEAIFEKAPCPISVKTRLGMEQPEEFEAILAVYHKYPIHELIIHPRVRKDLYRHPVRHEAFEKAAAVCKVPLSFNGGIVTARDVLDIQEKYPKLRAIMTGQGMVSDPFLAEKLHGGRTEKKRLRSFHDELLDTYEEQFGSRNNAVKRMKELWFYLSRLFEESERPCRNILKAKTSADYDSAVATMFELPLLEHSAGGW